MRYSILVFFLLLIFMDASTQRFGGFPPSTRWRQLNSDTATVIYAPGAGEQASRIAAIVHQMAADTPFAMGSRTRKIRILLHNRTTYANGYVALGPFRSEFYLIPGANIYELGNLSWYENLAIHEYRHVQQYNNFRNGWSRAFLYLFGEEGLALANAMAIPDWFFEGDAVHAETALTTQGRGRLPYFLSGYNSLWVDGRNYSWQKLRNGSLKDYVPNHYQLGYLLANYGYLKYGDEFWKKVTGDASAFRGIFYPFQKAVKKHSGVNFKTFRNEALAFYRNNIDSAAKEKQSSRTVQNYYHPQYIGSDSLLYMKTAYNRLPAFHIRSGGRERQIGLRGISSEEWFSYRNGKIAFTTFSTNPRWSLVDYSDITIMDLSGKRSRLTKREKYFTPDFSPSGDRLIAIRITDSLETHLEVLDASSGNVLQIIRPSEEWYFTNPRFVNENTIVAGRRTPDQKMSLQLYHLEEERWEELIPPVTHVISLPFVHGDMIYFTSNITGNDEIYGFSLTERALFRYTQDVTGNYFPSADGRRIVWSDFTSAGLTVREAGMNEIQAMRISLSELNETRSLFPVALPENGFRVQDRVTVSEKYSKSSGLLNFHSWRPDFTDPEFTFTIFSNNILNTFSSQFYYRYNRNENSSGLGVNASYAGFYPVLRIGAEKIFNRNIRGISPALVYEQSEIRLGYYIPFNFTRGRTLKFLTPGSDFVFGRFTPTGISRQFYRGGDLNYLRHFISWAHQLPVAIQHIVPRFGLSGTAQFRHLTDDENYQGIVNANLFLPSFANHGIVVNGAFQQRDTGSVVFSNLFPHSRGYGDRYNPRMWKIGLNYHFPILYPDLGFASIVYFQRIRGNGFYDFTRHFNNMHEPLRDLRSAGLEIYFDTRWWNQQPVSFGFRTSYLLDDGFYAGEKRGSIFIEFVLPVNLIPG